VTLCGGFRRTNFTWKRFVPADVSIKSSTHRRRQGGLVFSDRESDDDDDDDTTSNGTMKNNAGVRYDVVMFSRDTCV
jgi:hypothetical protein